MNQNKQILNHNRQQPMMPMMPMGNPNGGQPPIGIIKSNGNDNQVVASREFQQVQPVQQVQQVQQVDDFTTQLQEFLNILNQQPDPQQVKINQFANNSSYLPIEYLESQLDIVFGGLWQLKHVAG